MKVTVNAKKLSGFVFACVNEFFKANEEWFDGLSKEGLSKGKDQDPFQTLSYCYAAGVLSILRNTLHEKKKIFMRLTMENVKTNFKKGLHND